MNLPEPAKPADGADYQERDLGQVALKTGMVAFLGGFALVFFGSGLNFGADRTINLMLVGTGFLMAIVVAPVGAVLGFCSLFQPNASRFMGALAILVNATVVLAALGLAAVAAVS